MSVSELPWWVQVLALLGTGAFIASAFGIVFMMSPDNGMLIGTISDFIDGATFGLRLVAVAFVALVGLLALDGALARYRQRSNGG